MDVSYGPPLFDCQVLLAQTCWDPLAHDQASDPGYFSATSSMSPTSSVDTCSFSPAHLGAAGPEPDALDFLLFGSPAVSPLKKPTIASAPASSTRLDSSPPAGTITKRSRSRYPGRKRQTASEREKLRMRDLTKALHHVRSFLPPSVAPAGQTLTKIETLRLTIQYISHLSSQLGLSQDVLESRGASSVEQFPAFPQSQNAILGYIPEEPQYVAMDTTEQACGAQQTHPVYLQNCYQGSDGSCGPCFNGQYWTAPDLLQQTMFSTST